MDTITKLILCMFLPIEASNCMFKNLFNRIRISCKISYFFFKKSILAFQGIATTYVCLFINVGEKYTFRLFCTDVLILICSVLNHLQTVNPHSTSTLPAPTDYRIVKHSLTKHLQSSRKKINGSSILVSTM